MRKRFTLSYFIHFIGFLEFGFFALENNIQTAENPWQFDWKNYISSIMFLTFLSTVTRLAIPVCLLPHWVKPGKSMFDDVFWGTWWKLYAKCSFTVAPHLTLASKGVGVSFRRSKSSGPRKINHVVHRRNIRGWKTWGTLSVKSSIEILWIHLIWWKSNNPSEILARSQANSRRSAWLILLNLSSKFNSL